MKATLIVIIALAATVALRKRSAALRHWVLAMAIAAAVIAPLAERVLPEWSLLPGATTFVEKSAPATEPEPERRSSSTRQSSARRNTDASTASAQGVLALIQRVTLAQAIAATWIAGGVACLLVLAAGLARLGWLARRARPLVHGRWTELIAEVSRENGLRRRVTLLQSDHPSLLVTWGVMRPKIILPAAAMTWPDDLARVIIAHELAHIRRGDWIVQMVGELLRSIYWFSPFVWIACRRLRLESEHACDDAVLNRGIQGSEYATRLLDLARALNHRRAWVPAAAMARPSSLQRRVSAMLNVRLDRNPISRPARFAITAAALVLALAIASAQAFTTLSGTLVDPTGGVLPGVTVKLTNVERQAKYEVRSNASGQFEFPGLLPGAYDLEAQLPGFRSYQANVTMGGEKLDRRIAMEVGRLQESITILDGAAPAPRRPNASAVAPRSNPPCGAPAAPSAGVTRVGGNIRPPHKIKDAKPEYPAALHGTGTEATVIIDGKIGVEGFIKDIQVREGADATFASATIAAVNQWQFDSTLLNCVPVEPSITITAKFVAK